MRARTSPDGARREPRHRNCMVNLDTWTGIVQTYIANRSKRGVPVAIINWTRQMGVVVVRVVVVVVVNNLAGDEPG